MAVTKRKLKAPGDVVVMRPPAEIALAAKRIELNDYREAHKAAVAAQIADERAAKSDLKRDPGLAVEKRKLNLRSAYRATGVACRSGACRTGQDFLASVNAPKTAYAVSLAPPMERSALGRAAPEDESVNG